MTKNKMDDTFIKSLQKDLNKLDKKKQVAYFLGEDGVDSPSLVKGYVSTGSDILDIAISNRADGGLPHGRVTLIGGLESSGKSLIIGHILANAQKAGGIAILFDTENAISEDFLESMGVDISPESENKLMLINEECLENIFEYIEMLIKKISEKNFNKPIIIAIDSIAGATTKVEQEGDYDKAGWNTSKAIVLSQALRKITPQLGRHNATLVCTSQYRDKLGVTFGDALTFSGGHSLPYHSSVILKLKRIGKITVKVNGVDEIIGVNVRAEVVKNKIGPPFRKVEFKVFFDRGIDNEASWLTTLKAHDIVTVGGAWYTYNHTDETGEIIPIKFQEKTFKEKIMNVPEYKTALYELVLNKMQMKYRSGDLKEADMNIITDLGDTTVEEVDPLKEINIEESFKN